MCDPTVQLRERHSSAERGEERGRGRDFHSSIYAERKRKSARAVYVQCVQSAACKVCVCGAGHHLGSGRRRSREEEAACIREEEGNLPD